MAGNSEIPKGSFQATSRVSNSSVLNNILRDIQLVKAQLGEDRQNIRFLKIHKAHVSLSSLVAGAKETFGDKELLTRSTSLLVQFRDQGLGRKRGIRSSPHCKTFSLSFKDGDFVSVRDDKEIQLLNLSELIGKVLLKFVPLSNASETFRRYQISCILLTDVLVEDENKEPLDQVCLHIGLDSSNRDHTSFVLATKEPKGVPVPRDVDGILSSKLANTENVVKQLSANFGIFRQKVLQDLGDLAVRLDNSDRASQTSLLPGHPPCRQTFPSIVPALSHSSCDMTGLFAPPAQMHIPKPPSFDVPKPMNSNNNTAQIGAVYAIFVDSLLSDFDHKVVVTGKKHSERLYVTNEVLVQASKVGDQAGAGNRILEFAKSVLLLTAQEACGCPLRHVLQDLQISSGKELVLAFCTSSGNRIMKILYHWGSCRWTEDSIGKNKFTETLNAWIRSQYHGSHARKH